MRIKKISKNFKFSLIIPFHNSCEHVGRCIKSVSKSTLIPSEIIIVDDFSVSDESKKCKIILKKFKKLKIKYFKLKKNIGPGGARNYGVKKSLYNKIFFIDSDTEVLKNTFSIFKKNINKYDAVVGVYDLEPINKTLPALYKTTFYSFLYKKKITKYDHFSASCSGIKKKCYIKSGGYDPFFKKGLDFENEEFGYRISSKFSMILNKNMKVRHFFPSFLKMSFLFFVRTQFWMEMFLVRKKFSSTATSSNTALNLIYSPFILIFIVALLYYKTKLFLIAFLFTSALHINAFKSFYFYHFKKNLLNSFIMFFISNFYNLIILTGSLVGFFKFYLNLSKIKRKFN